MEGGILQNALIFLGISLLTVPIAKRLGIGSVLGYLLGGIIIGPYVLGLIGQEGEDLMHMAEFGVVMMLFVIGLELNPQSFWRMRKTILGMGASQMLLTSALLFFPLMWYFSVSWQASLLIALSLSMSSTAIVLQTLKEKNLGKTPSGIASFSVLLFQDIAVIPILALVPLLATNQVLAGENHEHGTWVDGLSAPSTALLIVGVVAAIIAAGRFIINPFLHWIAKAHIRELFTVAALFIVIAVAWLMEQVGLSAALGAFLAGVLLANSEFRHELETDIDPFKGVLLGLFFTAVGSTVNFELIIANTSGVLLFVFGVMLLKSAVLAIIAMVFRFKIDQNVLLSILLGQVGEFAFILLASIAAYQFIDKAVMDFIVAGVTLSMLLSPIFLFINEKIRSRQINSTETGAAQQDHEFDEHNEVIIAGFGHFGSTLGRFLRANGVHATILDNDSERVQLLQKIGFKVYFGDATRMDLLEKAGISQCKIFISAMDSPEKNLELVDIVQKNHPQVRLFVRSKNRFDAYDLIDKSVEHIYRESLHTSVQMGIDVLEKLGHRKYTATRKAASFVKFDENSLKRLAETRKVKQGYIESVREEIETQEKLLQEDAHFATAQEDFAWDNKRRKE